MWPDEFPSTLMMPDDVHAELLGERGTEVAPVTVAQLTERHVPCGTLSAQCCLRQPKP
jgi:hypothetical protein